MEFGKKKRVGGAVGINKKRKASLLDMYEKPGEVLPEICDIEEFYQSAYDRVTVLHCLEEVHGKYARNNVEFEPYLNNTLRSKNLQQWISNYSDPLQSATLKEVDILSHFILRLAYCQSEELRRWYLSWETELFRIRLDRENTDLLAKFLEEWNLTFDSVSPEEKAQVINAVISSRPQANAMVINSSDLYKIHFTMVPDLVSRRKVFVRHGMAYLLAEDRKHVIVAEFRSYLSRMLAKLSTCSRIYLKDDQVAPLMKLLARRQISTEQKFMTSGSVTPAELDQLSKDTFPLCMSSMHDHLREHHHLKHTGRLSYTLFLKGIGLSLEDSLKFFSQEFSRSVGLDKFNKEYAYAIRHAYGKEGKRADYKPYNCLKMISLQNPAGNDCHGCPYKTLEIDALKTKLRGLGISTQGINGIIADVSSSNFQGACSKTFENRTKRVLHGTICHPNQFHEEGLKVIDGTSQLLTDRIKMEKVVIKSQKKMKVEDDMDDFEELIS